MDGTIRSLYPTGNKFGARTSQKQDEATEGKDMPLGAPIDAPPGTAERLLALAERASNGLSIFHENDNDSHEGRQATLLTDMERRDYAELISWREGGKKKAALSPSGFKRFIKARSQRSGYGGSPTSAREEEE